MMAGVNLITLYCTHRKIHNNYPCKLAYTNKGVKKEIHAVRDKREFNCMIEITLRMYPIDKVNSVLVAEEAELL
jgi:hypothetical protein